MKAKNMKRLLLVLSTALSFLIAYLCLANRVINVYQSSFMIPVILACFWYERKGVAFSVAISAAHVFMFVLFNDHKEVGNAISYFSVYIVIAILVYILAGRVNKQQKTLRSLYRKLQNDLERFKKVEELAACGNWEMNLKTRQIKWSDGLYKIFGREPQEFEPTYNKRLEMAHPADRDFVNQTIQNSMRNHQNTWIESRIIRPDGSIRWVSSIGYIENDENNEPQTYISSILDITERKLIEEREKYDLKRNEKAIKIFTKKSATYRQLLDCILTGAMDLTNSKIGALYYYDIKEKYFSFRTASETGIRQCDDIKDATHGCKIASEHFERAIHTGQPFLINDAKDTVQNLSGFIIVPLTEDNETVSAVFLSGKETDFTKLDVKQVLGFLSATWQSVKQKVAESFLSEEREKYKTTITSIGDGVISTDANGKIDIINKVAENLTEWTQKEALGKPLDEVFHIINEKTRKECENPAQKVISSGLTIGLANHTALISRYGNQYSIADSAAPIKDHEGKMRGVVLVFRNVTEEKRRQDEIHYISYHDSLTGLYNRRYFEDQLKKIDTPENLPISIIMGDVNALKITNDAFGHIRGDELLQKTAEAIKEVCRENDVAARWGGDEFVILLPKTSWDQASETVSRMKNISSDMKVSPVDVSISFGCGTKVDAHEDLLKTLKNAEDHMYENKIVEGETVRGNLVTTIINTLHEKDPDDEQHSKRVGELCQKIGRAMGLPKSSINKLKAIGLLHDIGKIAISDSILNKPGRLTEEEWNQIRRHPDIGYRILRSSKELGNLADYVMAHHERFDGTGYPKGLKGEDIPLYSRIVSVADAYDAMISDRSYRRALAPKEAIAEIINGEGRQFDPIVVDSFLKALA